MFLSDVFKGFITIYNNILGGWTNFCLISLRARLNNMNLYTYIDPRKIILRVLLLTRHAVIQGDLNARMQPDAFQIGGDLNVRNPTYFKWGSRVNRQFYDEIAHWIIRNQAHTHGTGKTDIRDKWINILLNQRC